VIPWTPLACNNNSSVCLTGTIAMQSPQLIERVRAEFVEMPGLCLTHDQVRRFCGIDPALVQHVLDARFLYVNARGCYVRLTDVTQSDVAA
jgi:hypothetical protein